MYWLFPFFKFHQFSKFKQRLNTMTARISFFQHTLFLYTSLCTSPTYPAFIVGFLKSWPAFLRAAMSCYMGPETGKKSSSILFIAVWWKNYIFIWNLFYLEENVQFRHFHFLLSAPWRNFQCYTHFTQFCLENFKINFYLQFIWNMTDIYWGGQVLVLGQVLVSTQQQQLGHCHTCVQQHLIK